MADLDLRDESTGKMQVAKGENYSLWVDASPQMVSITLDDAGNLNPPLIGIRVNVDGTLRIRSTSGTDFTLTVVAGEYIPGAINRVYDTGTVTITGPDLIGYKRG